MALDLINDLLLVPGSHHALHVEVGGEEAHHPVRYWHMSEDDQDLYEDNSDPDPAPGVC